MRITVSLLSALFASFAIACSDKEDDLHKLGLIRSVTEGFEQTASPTVYEFNYDKEGRVRKVGPVAFYYGSNGKVSYSRSHRSAAEGTFWGEEVRRLSYRWDAQGRLKEVFLDSLYINATADGAALKHIVLDGEHYDNLVKNVRIAHFSYDGDSNQPHTIFFRRISDQASINGAVVMHMVTVEPEESIAFYYEDGNVIREDRQRAPDSPGPVGGGSSVLYKRFSQTPHYLYAVYEQLGFHPLRLDEVVSRKLENQAVRMTDESADPRWDYAQPFEIEGDAEGRLVNMTFGIRTVSGGLISGSAFRSTVSVRYY